MAKGAYIGVASFEPRELPEGYTQLEYIESSGTQYIDTLFKPNQDTRVVMDVQMVEEATDYAWFYGARTSGQVDAFGFFWNYATDKFGGTYGTSQVDISSNLSETEKLHIDQNKNQLTFNTANYSFPSSTFSCPVNLTLFVRNTNGTLAAYTKAKLYSCRIYDNGQLVRDYVPCKNPSGAIGLFDVVTQTFSGNTGTSAFTAGDTIKSVARKIKKGYIGVAAKARKIKKAYIGIGGVARPCWAGGELAYYGTITPLSKARWMIRATSVGDYAIFAGGSNGNTNVDAYSSSLTKTTPSSCHATMDCGAATVGNYALFGGGTPNGASADCVSTVTAYSNSLTKLTPTGLRNRTTDLAATSNGSYAVFAGGKYTGSGRPLGYVSAYNTSLTRLAASDLPVKASGLAATRLNNLAIFGGGEDTDNYDYRNQVCAYDGSLTQITLSGLNESKSDLAATTVANYAIFAGGSNYNTFDSADAYNESLTKILLTALSVKRYSLAATTIQNYALFGGGRNNSILSVVDVYDDSLTRKITSPLSKARYELAAATIGNYAIFGGGYDITNVVDAYTIA